MVKLRSVICVLVSLSGAVACANQVEPAEPTFGPSNALDFRVSEMTCADLLTLREAARSNTYTMLYGYVAGQKQQSLQKRSVVERVTLAAIETCQSDLYKTAIDAFTENWEVGQSSSG